MNPHEAIKRSCEALEPGVDFTSRVLQAAEEAKVPKRRGRVSRAALVAAILVVCLTVTVTATGVWKDWIRGAVEVQDEALLSEMGELLMEQDVNGMHVRYGQFLCVGRFLYMEVEITKKDGTPVTWDELHSVTFDDTFGYGLTLDYDDAYFQNGYPVEGEGYNATAFRVDDGSTAGTERYTLAWTLFRHDYDGTTLHAQIWEPRSWEAGQGNVMQATNSTTRKLLAEADIPRKTPENELCFHLENGDEVRVCAFGAEIQGTAFVHGCNLLKLPLSENGTLQAGVVLKDGTKVSFLRNPAFGEFPEAPAELQWSAAAFSMTIDPAQAAALYLGDEVWTLVPIE